MSGNRISVVIGILIAIIGTRFLEDGNLLITVVAILLAAMMTRTFWEMVKVVKSWFQ